MASNDNDMTLTERAEKEIESAAANFASTVGSISDEPYFRQAVMQIAMREIIWKFYGEFENERHELADFLDDMGSVVRQQIQEDNNA